MPKKHRGSPSERPAVADWKSLASNEGLTTEEEEEALVETSLKAERTKNLGPFLCDQCSFVFKNKPDLGEFCCLPTYRIKICSGVNCYLDQIRKNVFVKAVGIPVGYPL